MPLQEQEKKSKKIRQSPRSSLQSTDPEELRKESDAEARKIEIGVRDELLSMLRKGNASPRELNDLIRAFDVARSTAYPQAAQSVLSLTVPAKLLKPIEQAILSQRKSVDRAKPSKRLDVHSQNAAKSMDLQAKTDSVSVQSGTSDKDHSVNLADNSKSVDESST